MSKRLPFFLLASLLATLATAAPADVPEEEAEDKDEKIVYGQTIVVTGSRIEEEIAEAPVSLSVIDAAKIETTPARNYADLLRGVPGLNVIQTSARDLNFTSRGATSTLSTSQLTLVDGRSVYLDFFGFVMWDLLPVGFNEIEQIEILRGPGSAVWGANALNGVINVRTKTPRALDGGSVMVSGGERGAFGASLMWADAVDEQMSYKISASYFEEDAWDRSDTLPSGEPLPPSAVFENEGTEQPKFSVRFDYEPDMDQGWIFEGGTALTSGIIHTGIGPFSVDDSTFVGFGRVSYRRGALDTMFYLNRLDGNGTNLINGLDFDFETTVFNAEMTHRKVIGTKQVLVWGGNGRTSTFDLSIAPLDDSRTELGAFLEDRITLSDKVQVNVGARVDWFDTIGTTFSPRTSLLVKPHEDHTLRFAYNRAFRAPSLVQNYLLTVIPNAIVLPGVGQFVFPTSAVGNPDLREEQMDAIELGWIANVAERATLSVAWYRNETKDVMDFFPSQFYSADDPPPGWPLPPMFVPPFTLPKQFTYRNVGKVIDMGVEVSADVWLTNGVSTTLTYAWQDDPEIEDETGTLILNTPPTNSFGAQLNFDRNTWFGSFGLTFTDEAFWSDVLDSRFWGTTDSYWLVNASIGVRLADRYVAQLRATNLFNEEVQQHVFGDIIGRRVAGEVRVGF